MSRIFCVCAVQKRRFSLGKKTSLSHFREARPPYGLRGGNLGTMSCPHRLLALRLLLVCVLGAVRSGAGPYHRRTLLPATARYASGHLLIALYRFFHTCLLPSRPGQLGLPGLQPGVNWPRSQDHPPWIPPVRQSRVWKENHLPTWDSTPPALGSTLLSHVQHFVTPRTAARQAPLSVGFPRQEYWSGLPCPPPGDLPDPGIERRSSAL